MSAFKQLDLSQVPLPKTLQAVEYESTLNQLKQQLIEKNPAYSEALSLESEPLNLLLQSMAYQKVLAQQGLNDALKATLLATASGDDLDAIGARYNVARQYSQDGQESDDRFRSRIQLAFDGLNTAGSKGSYEFHTLSVSADIADVYVESPKPCDILLTILSKVGNGSPSATLLSQVRAVFTPELEVGSEGLNNMGSSPSVSKVRPIGDRVRVQGAEVLPFTIEAEMEVLEGPSSLVLKVAAQDALDAYLASRKRLGAQVTRAGIFGALALPGVENVRLLSPIADIKPSARQVAHCISKSVQIEEAYA